MTQIRYTPVAGRYAGRRALISGGANGLGYAIAARLAAEGAEVGLIDLDAEVTKASSRRLADAGFRAVGYAADVTDAERIDEVVREFSSAGSIDVLVTCAGIFPWIEFADMTIDKWREVVDVNLGGVFSCAHSVMPMMKQQCYGRILTISSGTVFLGLTDQSAYIASKAGIIGLTRVLAREGGAFGITSNCVLPGLNATDAVLHMRDDVNEFFEAVVAQQCIQRRGVPDDIADVVSYLCSEGAEFVTGQSLSVGGGAHFQ